MERSTKIAAPRTPPMSTWPSRTATYPMASIPQLASTFTSFGASPQTAAGPLATRAPPNRTLCAFVAATEEGVELDVHVIELEARVAVRPTHRQSGPEKHR